MALNLDDESRNNTAMIRQLKAKVNLYADLIDALAGRLRTLENRFSGHHHDVMVTAHQNELVRSTDPRPQLPPTVGVGGPDEIA